MDVLDLCVLFVYFISHLSQRFMSNFLFVSCMKCMGSVIFNRIFVYGETAVPNGEHVVEQSKLLNNKHMSDLGTAA